MVARLKQCASQVAGTPLLHNVGVKQIILDIEQYSNPTRRRQPFNSVRLIVCYVVQCVHEDCFTPTLWKGGSRPAVLRCECPILYPLSVFSRNDFCVSAKNWKNRFQRCYVFRFVPKISSSKTENETSFFPRIKTFFKNEHYTGLIMVFHLCLLWSIFVPYIHGFEHVVLFVLWFLSIRFQDRKRFPKLLIYHQGDVLDYGRWDA